jgi:hypothetical protein
MIEGFETAVSTRSTFTLAPESPHLVPNLQRVEPRETHNVGNRVFVTEEVLSAVRESVFENGAETLDFHSVAGDTVVAGFAFFCGSVDKEVA